MTKMNDDDRPGRVTTVMVSRVHGGFMKPSEPNDMSFGETLRHDRKETGMSLAQVARRVGASKDEVMSWERGERVPMGAPLARLRGSFPRLKKIHVHAAPARNQSQQTELSLPEAARRAADEATPSVLRVDTVAVVRPSPPEPERVVTVESGAPGRPLIVKMEDEKGQYSRVETIDPSLAELLLKGNLRNRSLSKVTVSAMVRDMISGRWVLTHQGIALDSEGRLIDGQHRLTAVVQSGVTVQMVVTYNADPTSFPVIDRNRTRSIGDMLGLAHEGVRSPTAVVAVLRLIDRIGAPSDQKHTYDEVDALYAKYGEDAQWTVSHMTTRGLRVAGILAGVAYALPVARDKIQEFVSVVCGRTGMTSPMAALWGAAERHRNHNTDDVRLGLMHMTMRCLYAHERGEDLKKTYRKEGNEPDRIYRHWRHRREKMGLPV